MKKPTLIIDKDIFVDTELQNISDYLEVITKLLLNNQTSEANLVEKLLNNYITERKSVIALLDLVNRNKKNKIIYGK